MTSVLDSLLVKVAGVTEALLEGFAPDDGPKVLDGRVRPGDHVRVPVKGAESLVGRVVRPSDAHPSSHVIIAPQGGGPHVEAPLKSAVHDTPERRAREVAKSLAQGESAIPEVRDGKTTFRKGQGGIVPGRPVRESALGVLLEGFKPNEPRDFHGRWIGLHRGKVLRVFHGQASLGDVEAGSHDSMVSAVQRTADEAGRPMTADVAARVVRTAEGTSAPTPRVIPKGGNANELRGGIPMLHDPRGPVKPEHVDPSRHPTPTAGLPPDALALMRARQRVRAPQRELARSYDEGRRAAATRAEILAKSPSAQRELDEYQSVLAGARASSPRGRARRGPLDEIVNFGGVPMSKGDVIRTLQREGHPQAYIDRYMQGLERRKAIPRVSESGSALDALLREAFAPPGVAGPGETPAQSMARGAAQVKQANAALAAWNASKHPRGSGGKFAYTTGSKRAHVGSSKPNSGALSTKGYGNFVQVGARGALVQSIQRQLGIKADGVFGPQTRAAIMRFQTNHGLKVDGVVGAQTIAALRGNAKAPSIAAGPLHSKVARVVKHAPRVRPPVLVGGGVKVG